MVSERGLDVLRAIVQDYVATREPVGSKSIVERHAFGVSAATIRNDMALLEDEELISAPHTSSGRVPTDKGYRVFVDHLAELRPLSTAQRNAIATFLEAPADLDDLLARLGVDRLVVAGAETDACIRSTIHGAFARGYDTVLVSDAHTAGDKTAWGAPSVPDVIAHTNLYWSFQSAPGKSAGTATAGEVALGR